MNKRSRLFLFFVMSLFFCILSVSLHAQVLEWRLGNATYNSVDPDGGGPATGSVTFTLQIHSVSTNVNNINTISLGWSYQSTRAMVPANPGCTIVSSPANVVVSPAFATTGFTFTVVNQCGVFTQNGGGQIFDRRVVGTLDGTAINLTSTWTDVFSVTLWSLSAVAPQAGYAVINSGSGGSPAAFPTYAVADISAREFAVNSQTFSSPLPLGAAGVPVTPAITTTSPSAITSTTAVSGGTVTSDGGAMVTERGVVYGLATNPTTANTKLIDATGGAGTFISNITGLNSSTTYHVRAYAINSAGTAYGNDINFTTSAASPCQSDNIAPVIIAKNITVSLDATGHASIVPLDVIQSVSDNCAVDNTSFTVSPSSFDCSNIAQGATTTVGQQAQTSPANTGNQPYAGEVGNEFNVNAPAGITITKLGAFDDLGDGIYGTAQQSGGIRVAVFKKSDKTIVPGLDMIIKNTEGSMSGNYRMKDLVSPIILPPGTYVVVAKGYNSLERLHNAGIPGGSPAIPHDGGGVISFTSSPYGADDANGFAYPENPYPTANVLVAATFEFLVGSNVPASQQAQTSPANTGNQPYAGEAGNEFEVHATAGITITKLGAFDDLGDGIHGTTQQSGGIRVAVFKKSDKTIVPGLDMIIKNTEGSMSGNYRMKDLVSPVTLSAGTYVVVAKGYNNLERLHNAGIPGGSPAIPHDGGGAILFTSSPYGTDDANGFAYPENPYAIANVLVAGTFEFLTGTNASSSQQAQTSPASAGNQPYAGEVGNEFEVHAAAGITISKLGAFDDLGDGIHGTAQQSGGIRVAVFKKSDKTIVPGLDMVIANTEGLMSGNYRMKDLSSSVTLPPGTYVVVAKGYNSLERLLNAGVPGGSPAVPNGGGGAILFTSSPYGPDDANGFSYPENPYSIANVLVAGTFAYSVAGNNNPGRINVTIKAKDINGNTGQTTATVTVTDPNGACSTTSVTASSVKANAAIVHKKITVYPNPANGRFTIQVNDPEVSKALVEIYNVNGTRVAQKPLPAIDKTMPAQVAFDLTNQPSGVYYIKVTGKTGIQASKIVILH